MKRTTLDRRNSTPVPRRLPLLSSSSSLFRARLLAVMAAEASPDRSPPPSTTPSAPRSLLYSSLPPPLPIAVRVRGLTIQAPVAKITLPLVPIEVPRWKKGDGAVPKELVRRVSATVEPGEVMAMFVCVLLPPQTALTSALSSIGGSGSGKSSFSSSFPYFSSLFHPYLVLLSLG
jgi:hypothetical protein